MVCVELKNIVENYKAMYENDETEADEWLYDMFREMHEADFGFEASGVFYLRCDNGEYYKLWTKEGDIITQKIEEREYYMERFISDLEAYNYERNSIRWLLKHRYEVKGVE